ncbi:hypothetical protein [Oricola indica]|uniref:hypothetical protein n=1 Tax=Oricola indica TaxID=2872591 RepID=UPI001CC1AE62|nr:hypothetical protein [Oricola indica]
MALTNENPGSNDHAVSYAVEYTSGPSTLARKATRQPGADQCLRIVSDGITIEEAP